MGIIVVGLGPGNGRHLTREAWDILTSAQVIYLRTSQHPTVAELPSTIQIRSFDHLYEKATSFEQVYSQIVDEVLAQGKSGDIVYAVPGHPYIGESTVIALVKAAQEQAIPVQIVAGLSFVEPTLTAVAVDALDGLQIFDAIDITQFLYPPFNPDTPVLLGQVYNRFLASELKMTLTAVYPDEHPVTLVHAAGTVQQQVEAIPLYAIDRSPLIDHLTSLYIPALPYKASLTALAETVAVLRSPEGCPWDQEQTPQSLRGDILEETGELLAALDNYDQPNICEELGDVFYHLVMQAQLGSETEDFKLTDVLAGIEAKLKRRHPHVWGDWSVANSAEVVRNWEMLKAQEKDRTTNSLLDGIPVALPALSRSQKIQKRVRKVGFDWPDIDGVYSKVLEEIVEIQKAQTLPERTAEIGDLFFVVANLANWLGVDAEVALREANLRFTRRFQEVEKQAADRQQAVSDMNFETLNQLWDSAKRTLAETESLVKLEATEISMDSEE